jgi:hypothetical protein
LLRQTARKPSDTLILIAQALHQLIPIHELSPKCFELKNRIKQGERAKNSSESEIPPYRLLFLALRVKI